MSEQGGALEVQQDFPLAMPEQGGALEVQQKSTLVAGMMQIFVQHGQSMAVTMGIRRRVFSLQAIIHSRLGILPKEQRLIFEGKQLEPTRRLSYYGIQMGSTVHLVFRLRGSASGALEVSEGRSIRLLSLSPEELMQQLITRFGVECMQMRLLELKITTKSTTTVGQFICKTMGSTWQIIDSMQDTFPRDIIFMLAKAGLCDSRLPYSLEQLAKVPGLPSAFQQDFYEAQSQYCAVFFDEKEHLVLKSHESVPFRNVRGSRMRRGSFGIVHEVEEAGMSFAQKKVRYDCAATREAASHELEMLQRLPNDMHLLSLRASYEQNGAMYFILYPFVDTDLEEFLAGPNKFQWWKEAKERRIAGELILDWMQCMARGLAVLHANCVKHRDVKPGNLGLFVSNKQKMAQKIEVSPVWLDFGLAKHFQKDSKSQTQIGAPLFRSPEWSRGRSADIFSMATIYLHLLFLLNGVKMSKLKPYKTTGWNQICGNEEDVLQYLPSSNEDWTKMKKLITNMLHSDPRQRPTASDVVVTLAQLQIIEASGSRDFVPHCRGVPLPKSSPSKSNSTSQGSEQGSSKKGSNEDNSKEGSDEDTGEQLWSST